MGGIENIFAKRVGISSEKVIEIYKFDSTSAVQGLQIKYFFRNDLNTTQTRCEPNRIGKSPRFPGSLEMDSICGERRRAFHEHRA